MEPDPNWIVIQQVCIPNAGLDPDPHRKKYDKLESTGVRLRTKIPHFGTHLKKIPSRAIIDLICWKKDVFDKIFFS